MSTGYKLHPAISHMHSASYSNSLYKFINVFVDIYRYFIFIVDSLSTWTQNFFFSQAPPSILSLAVHTEARAPV